MNPAVARNTQWNNVEPMFAGIGEKMVVLLGLIWAVVASTYYRWGQFARPDSRANGVMSFFSQGMNLSILGGEIASFYFTRLTLAIFDTTLPVSCFARFGTTVFRTTGIVAQFAPISQPGFLLAVFGKIRDGLFLVAFGANLCLNWFVHSFSFSKAMFQPSAGYRPAFGSHYTPTWNKLQDLCEWN